MTSNEAIVGAITSRLPPETARALQIATSSLAERFDLRLFHAEFARAGRTLGVAPFVPNQKEAEATGNAASRSLVGWSVDHAARVALIAIASRGLDASAFATLVEDLYLRGEIREREAVLRALPHLPEPSRFVELAAEACRSNVRTVFEALACENAFPAARFSDLQFRQMVIKSLFVGVDVERIEGLAERVDAELVRMVEAHASERRAAGRDVPNDGDRVIALFRKGKSR